MLGVAGEMGVLLRIDFVVTKFDPFAAFVPFGAPPLDGAQRATPEFVIFFRGALECRLRFGSRRRSFQ